MNISIDLSKARNFADLSQYDQLALKDALRLAIQGALAASLTYTAMQTLGLQEYFVAILTAIFILSRTPDGSLGMGIDRIASTILGSAIGVVCLILLPYGWGTAVSLAVTMFILNGIAALRPAWQYGTVAAVALSLGSENDAVQTSIDRGLGIAVGVSVGMAVSLLVWPEFARKRYTNHRSRALSALADRLAQLSKAAVSDADPVSSDSDDRYRKAMRDAKSALENARFGADHQEREDLLRIERIYGSIIVLDRALEDGWNAGDAPHDLLENVEQALRDINAGESADTQALTLDDIDTTPEDADEDDKLRLNAVAFGLRELIGETQKLAGQSS